MHPKRLSSFTAWPSYVVGPSAKVTRSKKAGEDAEPDRVHPFASASAPLAPVIDTQKTLAYDQLFLCWRLPQDSAQAWHFSVEYQRRAGGAAATWGGTRSPNAAAAWQRLDDVKGTSAVVDRLQIDCIYVLRVRGCNKAGFGEYSEEVYLHTPPAPGELRTSMMELCLCFDFFILCLILNTFLNELSGFTVFPVFVQIFL